MKEVGPKKPKPPPHQKKRQKREYSKSSVPKNEFLFRCFNAFELVNKNNLYSNLKT